MNFKSINKIKVLIFLAAAALIIYVVNEVYHEVKVVGQNPISMTQTLPDKYSGLFTNEAKLKFAVHTSTSLKFRQDITELEYDDRYSLWITRIKVGNRFYFGHDVIETTEQSNGEYPETEKPSHQKEFSVFYNSVSTQPASKIYLSLSGDSVKTISKNDTVANYYLRLKNAYLQYKPGGVYEIRVEGKTGIFAKHRPLSMLFLKKDNWVYVLFLSIDDYKNNASDLSLDPDLLYSLLSH